MNVFSAFDGMSCGQIALRRTGIQYDNYYASEIKKHAIKVTQHNFPNTIQLGDIRNIKASDLPKIDLLIGGSPCQDFSSANAVRAGLKGEKSSLFYEYYRLLQELKPKFFLLENVRMDKKSYEIISRLMNTYPVNINSSRVSAQLRNRFYWTNIGPADYDLFGFRKSTIPQPKDKHINLCDIIENGFTDRIKARALIVPDSRPHKNMEKAKKRYDETGFGTLIYKDKCNQLVKTGSRNGKPRTQEMVYHEKGKISALTCAPGSSNCGYTKILSNNTIRYLTQLELERLQTVPEGYTSCLTRNQAANLLGDGWTIDVIAHIFSFLK